MRHRLELPASGGETPGRSDAGERRSGRSGHEAAETGGNRRDATETAGNSRDAADSVGSGVTGEVAGEGSEVDAAAGTPRTADFGTGSVFFVGTATVIVRYAGFTILTDPNFLHQGEHVHLGYGLTSERRTEPAIGLDELPADLDFVLLSHYHGDHFDRRVEAELDRSLPIVTTPHAAEELADAGFEATYPLEPWERMRIVLGDSRLDVTATPARHGPPVVEKALPPVMGSVLEFAPVDGAAGAGTGAGDDARASETGAGDDARGAGTGAAGDAAGTRDPEAVFRLYVSGDTVLYDDLQEIPRRFPNVDLALVHLGGTKVLGVLLTMDGEQGAEAVRLIGADTSIPIHYDDYEVFKSPLSEFRDAVAAAGLEDRVAYLDRGETYEFEVPAERLGE